MARNGTDRLLGTLARVNDRDLQYAQLAQQAEQADAQRGSALSSQAANLAQSVDVHRDVQDNERLDRGDRLQARDQSILAQRAALARSLAQDAEEKQRHMDERNFRADQEKWKRDRAPVEDTLEREKMQAHVKAAQAAAGSRERIAHEQGPRSGAPRMDPREQSILSEIAKRNAQYDAAMKGGVAYMPGGDAEIAKLKSETEALHSALAAIRAQKPADAAPEHWTEAVTR